MPRDLSPAALPDPSQAEQLYELAANAELFHTPDGRLYATVPVRTHRETWPLASRGFRLWLTQRFWAIRGKPPSTDAMKGALDVLQAEAQFQGRERQVFVRLGQGEDGAIYLDLGRPDWGAVKISAAGWEIVTDVPLRFRRPKGMGALPIPESGGTLELLRPLVNLPDADMWALFIAWLVVACWPRGPYPVLILEGEQGSAKSWLARILRALLDPCSAPIRSAPREERSLMIAATNNLILAYDNLSSIPDWLSDAFCRISTGGGTSVRSLYTDDEEVIFDVKRPLVLTGITAVIERDDLRDRALILKLPTIPERTRREESAVEAELSAVLPEVLGALLTAVSTAMRRLPDVRLPRLPRMADFARLATAAEPALGLKDGAFLTIYDTSRAEAIADSIDLSPVAKALRDFAPEATGAEGAWKGTASELLASLISRVGEQVSRARGWPTTPRTLSADLTRWQPALRQAGIMVERVKSGHAKTRNILIWRTPPNADAAATGGRGADAGADQHRLQANSGRDVELWETNAPADDADANSSLSSVGFTDEDLEERRAIEEAA